MHSSIRKPSAPKVEPARLSDELRSDAASSDTPQALEQCERRRSGSVRRSDYASAAGSPAASTSRAHSRRFQSGTGGSQSARGVKRERSTSCSLWM